MLSQFAYQLLATVIPEVSCVLSLLSLLRLGTVFVFFAFAAHRSFQHATMNNPQRTKQGTPLTSVFYTELVFVAVNVILCGYGILQPRVSFLLWLPCLLLLCGACVSLSSLIYLNKGISMKSKKDLLLYVLLTLVLVIFRIFCFCLLAIGLFAPHAVPGISSIVGAVVLFHAVFGLYSIGRASVLRMGMNKRLASKDSRMGTGVEEIAIISLASNPRALSQATLVTNLDEADLVSTVKP